MTADAPADAAMASKLQTYGGFWERSLAIVIDYFVMLIPNLILAQLLRDSAWIAQLVLAAVYATYFWSAAGGGQTPGMRVFGLRVMKEDGSALTVVGALVRWVGFIIAVLVLGIGVFWAAFHRQKKGWHDLLAGTIVMVEARAPHPVQVTFEHPATSNRFFALPLIGLLARFVLLVPHLVVLYFVGLVIFLALLVLWVPVLFNGRYPAWGFRLIGGYLRWSARLSAYLYGLTDRYPTPFEPGA
jgi:uncharacterized RDD family membrane protein YckC